MKLGRVAGAHGVRGALRIRYTGDDAGNLGRAGELLLGETPATARRFRVRSCRPGRPGEALVELEGVRDREGAEGLRGRDVFGRVERLEPLPEGEYYHFQLVGCRVVTPEGRELGRVRAIYETRGADLLAVVDGDGREHLLPTAPEFLREVRLEAREIRYVPIPGLLGDDDRP